MSVQKSTDVQKMIAFATFKVKDLEKCQTKDVILDEELKLWKDILNIASELDAERAKINSLKDERNWYVEKYAALGKETVALQTRITELEGLLAQYKLEKEPK